MTATAMPPTSKEGPKKQVLGSMYSKLAGEKKIKVETENGLQTFVIGKKLGKGTTAVVNEGVCKETGQRVAIKIRAKQKNKKDLEGFRKECVAMYPIRHENCIALYATHEDPSNYYMILEMMDGSSVMERILEVDVFTESDAITAIKCALSAVEYLHSRGIAHRDLKPENLMYVSKDPKSKSYNTVKLADFGFAKVTSAKSDLMKTVCGTPLYIAPEVLDADTPQHPGYDCKVDIWSLGVILYLLLCGFPPFIDKDVWKLFNLVRSGKVNFPSPFWDEVSDEAKDLIMHMLVPDSQLRWTAGRCLCHPFIHTLGQSRLKKLHSFHKAFTLVRRLPIFNNIDADALQQISENLRKVSVSPGEKIISTGEQATCMYFVGKGKCVVNSNGKEIDHLGTGDFFGEIALACDVRRTADVVAEVDSELYELSRDDFLKLLEAHPILHSRVAEVADKRVRRISESYYAGANQIGPSKPDGIEEEHSSGSDSEGQARSDTASHQDELMDGEDQPRSTSATPPRIASSEHPKSSGNSKRNSPHKNASHSSKAAGKGCVIS